jgi:hypothetical protein
LTVPYITLSMFGAASVLPGTMSISASEDDNEQVAGIQLSGDLHTQASRLVCELKFTYDKLV